MSLRSRNVPSRPAPSAPSLASNFKGLIPNGASQSQPGRPRSVFYVEGNKAKKNPPPRPPPPKILPQHLHRSSSLERAQPGRNAFSYHSGMNLNLNLPPPPSSSSSTSTGAGGKPKLNQDLATLIDLFSSPPSSSSSASTSSSPTLTHHSGSDGFSVNSLTMEEDFDPFSPRSLASRQKDSFNRLREESVLTQLKQPDTGLQRQYALLYGAGAPGGNTRETHMNAAAKNSAPVAPVVTSTAGPPKLRKPTVIRTGTGPAAVPGYHPPIAAKPLLSSFPEHGAHQEEGRRTEFHFTRREPSPPEPAVPPPKPPDLNFVDAPPALPPRRPHSEEPFNTDEPHAIVLFDYEKSHPDDLACAAGEVVYLVSKVNEDWYTCKKKHGSEEGMIPATFLDVVVPTRSTESPRPTGVPATALYDFDGEVAGDLSFPEGASILVEARINDEWLFGSFAGKRGQFPSNFVTPINVTLPQHEP